MPSSSTGTTYAERCLLATARAAVVPLQNDGMLREATWVAKKFGDAIEFTIDELERHWICATEDENEEICITVDLIPRWYELYQYLRDPEGLDARPISIMNAIVGLLMGARVLERLGRKGEGKQFVRWAQDLEEYAAHKYPASPE